MSDFTLRSWGIEQTRDMLWIGPMRPDGVKVDEVVAGLAIGPELTMAAAIKQLRNAHLIAAAPDLLDALQGAVSEIEDLRGYANNHGGMIDDVRCDYGRAAIAKALGKEEV